MVTGLKVYKFTCLDVYMFTCLHVTSLYLSLQLDISLHIYTGLQVLGLQVTKRLHVYTFTGFHVFFEIYRFKCKYIGTVLDKLPDVYQTLLF